MSDADREYFQKRALEERTRAESASSPEAARVHRTLAAKYEALVKKTDEWPMLCVAWDGELRKHA